MNIFNKIGIRQNLIYILVLFMTLAASIYTIPNAFGNFARMVNGSDSAFAAKFHVEVTAPGELDLISGENLYSHYFPMEGGSLSFPFTIHNNSEVSVICRPHIDGVLHYIIVDYEILDEFSVHVGETVDFRVIIMSEGLSADITETSLFVDIEQM